MQIGSLLYLALTPSMCKYNFCIAYVYVRKLLKKDLFTDENWWYRKIISTYALFGILSAGLLHCSNWIMCVDQIDLNNFSYKYFNVIIIIYTSPYS